MAQSPLVLTLVYAESGAEELVGAACDSLRELGADVGPVRWLADSKACDVDFSHASADEAESAVRRDLCGLAVDLAVQQPEGRQKRLLVADMESTVIRNEMLDELADFVGIRQQVQEITSRAMNNELDFREALDQRVALLRGLPISTLHEALETIRFDPGARSLVATSRAHGSYCALVSGGFTFFTDWVQDRVGFHEARANVLEIEDGLLTGNVVPPILDRDAKLRALLELCERLSIEPQDAVAVGDGANDLAMLQAAGMGVAFHGKQAVTEASRFRVDHGDLSSLLYFQGYGERQIHR
ncbi:MAG: phosphoserine phosphatase SerB [Thermoanaerobaculia bacterium]|nr:phosphoserine phosphatase SerB [Thermoanaerobaculia bacterium]